MGSRSTPRCCASSSCGAYTVRISNRWSKCSLERQQRLHRLSFMHRWLQLARHRVALCRVLFTYSLRRAWVWWCCPLWDPENCEEGSELIGCDPARVKQHMEYQRLQEFHQSVRDRNGTNACAVCFLPGSKRCSQCKSLWYCSRIGSTSQARTAERKAEADLQAKLLADSQARQAELELGVRFELEYEYTKTDQIKAFIYII